MRTTRYSLIVIGAGPAGLAAAAEARKEGLDRILVLDREPAPGGILRQCIHSGFGMHCYSEDLTGPEYAARALAEASGHSGEIEIQTDTMALEVSPPDSEEGEELRVTAVGCRTGLKVLSTEAVVMATGCRERTREAISIPGTRPAGIFTAGNAQKLVNMAGYLPGKRVMILGSGDIGLIMARRLTLEGARVLMVCELMPWSAGLNRNIAQCLEDYDIPLRLDTTVVRVHGGKRLEGVTIARVQGEGRSPVPDTAEYIACDTLLLAVGLIPENELSGAAGVQLGGTTGGPVVDDTMATTAPGIYACGNCVHVHDLADYVTLEGRRAGRSAARYVLGRRAGRAPATREPSVRVRVTNGPGVRYVVPYSIRMDPPAQEPADTDEEIVVYFRTDRPYRNARFTVTADGREILARREKIVTPGEMQTAVIRRNDLRGVVEITLIVAAEKGETV